MNLQLKDPSGNVLVSLESTPVTTTVESMTTDLVEATKAVESAFDETEKYSNAMAVMSSEGFGEQAKAVASKVWEKIKEFFEWLMKWCKKFKDFIVNKALKLKISKIKDPSAKQQMLSLTNDIDNVSEKLEKTSSDFVATIDDINGDEVDTEKLNETKTAQKAADHVRKSVLSVSSAMNEMAETLVTTDDDDTKVTVEDVKEARRKLEENHKKRIQEIRESMNALKQEADAVANKKFDEIDKLTNNVEEKLNKLSEINTSKRFEYIGKLEPTKF